MGVRALSIGYPHVYTEQPWPKAWHDWAGSTDFSTGDIYLHPDVARDLERLHRGWRPKGRIERIMVASSIHTLAHELVHRGGEHNENTAERVGFRTFIAVARRIGVGPLLAARLKLALLRVSNNA